MALADEYLAEIEAEQFDAWESEDAARIVEWARALPSSEGNDALRQARLLRAASCPVIQYTITLPAAGMPGSDFARDADLAASVSFDRRTALTNQSAGLNGRSVERNLRMLDRICALIAEWPEPDWSETVRLRVERLAEARRSGRERGRQLRAAGRLSEPPPEPSVPYLLRHPGDYWFRRARASIEDPTLAAAIDEWVADFARSYAVLADEDWSAEEERADAVVDLELPEELPRGPAEPVPTTVVATHHGSLAVGSELPLRLAPGGGEPFNGMLIDVLPRDRWRTCARFLADGSVLPADGTRRVEVAPSSRAAPARSSSSPA